MGVIETAGNSVFRDYVTDGVPSSGKNSPVKADIRALFGLIDSASFNASTTIKSVNTTIQDDDAGATIAADTGGITITFGVATDYAKGSHFNVVTNISALVVKVAVNGYSAFKLWPGQSAFVLRVGSVWQIVRPGIYITPPGFTLHVNHSTGNDTTGDGLSTGTAFDDPEGDQRHRGRGRLQRQRPDDTDRQLVVH